MNLRLLTVALCASFIVPTVAHLSRLEAISQSNLCIVHGETRDPGGLLPLANAHVRLHCLDEDGDRSVDSGVDGTFLIAGLKPGRYQLSATKEGFASSSLTAFDLTASQRFNMDVSLGPQVPDSPAPHKREAASFFGRLVRAYADDWKGTASSGPDPVRRGNPAPVDGPPFPFSDWPYGGSIVIGAPWTQSSPLMQALWSGPHGEGWKKSGVQVYGWMNVGCNVSTSHKSRYANFPEAYAEVSDACLPDQEVLYIERQPDTVQKDHFDWGFRITNLYGIDYRFTTAKGYFSHQLLGKNYEYGDDLVMAYVDLYFPHVADGMNVRIGRYISLPDIEAQLAPNNYTYSHSLLYTFDAYTQTGVNVTTKLDDHWMVQVGLSAGNDVAPWVGEPDAKPTFNSCVSFSSQHGRDNHYACLNSLNSGKYAYNNLQSGYYTWYHKFGDSSWHTATEWWYMWEKDVPNISPGAPASSASRLITGANVAFCDSLTALNCTAAEEAVVNYLEKQFSKHDYLTIRNEFFDDIRGQRTGTKTRYSEHLLGWGHWVGTTILFRPELRFEHSYDLPAYDSP